MAFGIMALSIEMILYNVSLNMTFGSKLIQKVNYTRILGFYVDSDLTSVPSKVRNLRKMRNFWANFTDFEPEINIIKCKTEKLKQKLEYFNARLLFISWKNKFNAKNL